MPVTPSYAFNVAEGVAWLTIAAVLPFRLRADWSRKRRVIIAAMLVFVAFGASDFLEATAGPRFAWWLWVWKIGCVTALLLCRRAFLGPRFRWVDRTHMLALACVAAVTLAMWLQRVVAG